MGYNANNNNNIGYFFPNKTLKEKNLNSYSHRAIPAHQIFALHTKFTYKNKLVYQRSSFLMHGIVCMKEGDASEAHGKSSGRYRLPGKKRITRDLQSRQG